MVKYDITTELDLKVSGQRSEKRRVGQTVPALSNGEGALRSHNPIEPGSNAHFAPAALRFFADPGRSNVSRYVLQLQRQYGNRYVQRFLSRVTRADDKNEILPDIETPIESKLGGTSSVDAIAFPTGGHTSFGSGAYGPDTLAERRFLPHERRHGVQQSGTIVQREFVPGDHDEKGDFRSETPKSAGGLQARSLIQPRLLPDRISRTPKSESYHPEEQDAEDASENPNITCAEIIRHIENLIEELAGRLNDLVEHKGGDAGHRERFETVQKILSALITKAVLACEPGEYDPELAEEAIKWANKPLPYTSLPGARDSQPIFVPGTPDLVPAFAREHPVLTTLIAIGVIVGAIIGVDEVIAIGAALVRIGAVLAALLGGASFASGAGSGGSDGGSKSGGAGTAGGAGSGRETGAGGAQGPEGTGKTGEPTAQTGEGKTDKGTSKTSGDADKAVAELMEALKRFADPKGDKISPEDAKKILELGLEFLNKLQTADPNDPNATRLKNLSADMIPRVKEAIKRLENASSQKNDEARKGEKDQPAGSGQITSDSHKNKEPKSGSGSGKAGEAPKSSQKPKGSPGTQGGAEESAFGATYQFQPKNFNPDQPPQPGTHVDLIGRVQIRGKRVELQRSATYRSTKQVDKNTRVAYFDLDDTSSVTIDGEEISVAKEVTVTMTRK